VRLSFINGLELEKLFQQGLKLETLFQQWLKLEKLKCIDINNLHW